MKLYDKWKDRILTRKTPAIIVHDVNTVEVVEGMIKESNHLKDPWADKGYEIRSPSIQIVIGGKAQPGYVCSSYGITVPLVEDIKIYKVVETDEETGETKEVEKREPQRIFVRWAGTIGKMTSADVIEKGMDLVGSNKKILIGIGIGIIIGWVIVGPVVSKILS